MQSTGHTGTHLSQPEHSSGMMITSMPWLKIAPNCGGQCRMQVSQLMQIDMSMYSGAVFHFGFRSRVARRSTRPAMERSEYKPSPGSGPDWERHGPRD